MRPRPTVLLVCLLSACATRAVRSIPDPPPEADGWTSGAAEEPGAYLGLETRENDGGTLDDLFFEPGVRVVRVDPHSPADAAGLRVGDVVLAWNGEELLEPESLEALARRAEPGDSATLEVRRDDSVFTVPVSLRGRTGDAGGSVELVARVDPVRSRARWITERDGIRLLASADDAPFPASGVPVGSLVHALDGRPVASAREWIRLLLAEDPGAEIEVAWTDADGERRETGVELLDVPRVITRFSIPILTTYAYDPDGDETRFVLLDLYVISLFRYTRKGEEREWRFLRFFSASSGVGELSE